MDIDAIKKLIETDENTRAEVMRQVQKRDNLKNTVDAQKKKLAEDAWADVNQQVADTKKQLDDQIAEIEAKSKAYYEKASANLEEQYNHEHDQWSKDIMNRILHGESA